MTFRIGRVIGTTLQLWGRNVVPVVLITLLLHSPLILWLRSVVPNEVLIRQLTLIEYSAWLMALPVSLLVSALLAWGVVAELQGRPLSLGGWLMGSVTRFVTATITTIVVSLCIGGLAVIIAIPIAAFLPGVAAIVAALAILYLYGLWYAAGPVCGIEGTGSLAALGRGRALAKGHRLAILCLLLLWLLVGRGLWFVVIVLTLDRQTAPSPLGSYLYFEVVREVVVGSLGGVMAGVTYEFLRAERDGASQQQLATVFE